LVCAPGIAGGWGLGGYGATEKSRPETPGALIIVEHKAMI